MDPVRVGDYNIVRKENKKTDNSALTMVKDRLGSAAGVYASADTTAKGLIWGAEVAKMAENPGVSDLLSSGGKTFKQIAGGTIVAYAGWAGLDFKDAVESLSKGDRVEGKERFVSEGKVQDTVKKFFTFLTAVCYSVLLFVPGASLLLSIATVSDLTDDLIDLKQNAEKFARADELQGKVNNKEVSGQLADQKKISLLGVVKAVIAVVAGIFGVLALVLKRALVPRIVELTLKLAAGILRGVLHFSKESMPVHLSFERVVQVA